MYKLLLDYLNKNEGYEYNELNHCTAVFKVGTESISVFTIEDFKHAKSYRFYPWYKNELEQYPTAIVAQKV